MLNRSPPPKHRPHLHSKGDYVARNNHKPPILTVFFFLCFVLLPSPVPPLPRVPNRVSLTYRVKSAHKVKLTDKQLLQWMVPILLVMLIFLGTWTLSATPSAEVVSPLILIKQLLFFCTPGAD